MVRVEGIFNGIGKFGWGEVKGIGFMGKTAIDSAAFDLGYIGNKWSQVSDSILIGLANNVISDFDTWKEVPGGIMNGIKDIGKNTPKFFTDANMSVDEISNYTNDIFNTACVVKGGMSGAKALKSSIGKVSKIGGAISDGAGNPYDLLKQKGIPSTLDDIDREILDSGNWRMQYQGAAEANRLAKPGEDLYVGTYSK